MHQRFARARTHTTRIHAHTRRTTNVTHAANEVGERAHVLGLGVRHQDCVDVGTRILQRAAAARRDKPPDPREGCFVKVVVPAAIEQDVAGADLQQGAVGMVAAIVCKHGRQPVAQTSGRRRELLLLLLRAWS